MFEIPSVCDICGENNSVRLVVDENVCIMNIDAVMVGIGQPVTSPVALYFFECGCCGVQYASGGAMTLNHLAIRIARRAYLSEEQ